MATGIYLGSSGVRKMKSAYVGVNGVVRKVKAVYAGIGGVVRCVWKNGLSKVTSVSPLSMARGYFAAAKVGDYLLFSGGSGIVSGSTCKTVDSYNSVLVKGVPAELNTVKKNHAGASVGNYALFAGGEGNDNTYQGSVNSYSEILTKSAPSALSKSRSNMANISIPGYAIFAGGQDAGSYRSEVDAYNTSLVKTAALSLATSGTHIGASVGNYAIIACSSLGNNGLIAYNTSLVRSPVSAFSEARIAFAGASIGNYALFAGGHLSNNKLSSVEVYNSSLVKCTSISLKEGRNYLASASIAGYAVFAGGVGSTCSKTVDCFNESLLSVEIDPLSKARYSFAGGSIGNYIIFAGGLTEDVVSSADTDSYTI